MMMFNILLLTGEQIRAARALARIEQTELARLAGLSLETIKRLERIRGPVEANARTLRAIQTAFEGLGISFEGDGTGKVGVSYNASTSVAGPGSMAAPAGPRRMRRLIAYSQLRQNGAANLRPTLAAIQRTADRLYNDHGLTGLKLVLDGYLLQAIEGEHDAVQRAYQYLLASTNHVGLKILDDRPAGQLIFADFSFSCGLFPSDLLPSDDGLQITRPFHPETLSASEAIGLLMAARKRRDEHPRNGCLTPASCKLSSLCLDPTCGDRPRSRSQELTPEV